MCSIIFIFNLFDSAVKNCDIFETPQTSFEIQISIHNLKYDVQFNKCTFRDPHELLSYNSKQLKHSFVMFLHLTRNSPCFFDSYKVKIRELSKSQQ